MTRKRRARLRRLIDVVGEKYLQMDASDLIVSGHVTVDGRVLTNPMSLVRDGASIRLRSLDPHPLRGEAKLRAALRAFRVRVRGRVALDLGAAAGGFTRVLLDAGTARVYAVDVGYGQLVGSLRQDPRVVNLERTNLAALSHELVPDVVELVTADLSYVSLAEAVPQLNARVRIAPDTDLVAVVKPQFELGLRSPPTQSERLADAAREAREGIERAGWLVMGVVESPIRGSRGSIEFLLHARRRC